MDEPEPLLDRMELEERIKTLAVYVTFSNPSQTLILADDALTILHHVVTVYEQERGFLKERIRDAENSISNGHNMLSSAIANIQAERTRADKIDKLVEQNAQIIEFLSQGAVNG